MVAVFQVLLRETYLEGHFTVSFLSHQSISCPRLGDPLKNEILYLKQGQQFKLCAVMNECLVSFVCREQQYNPAAVDFNSGPEFKFHL